MGNTSPWAATFCRASLLSLDKLQAASCKQQAASFKLRQSVIYAPDTGMVIWSRAARELVSTIRSKPCEACIRGEAGGSSQQKGNLCKNLHLSLTTKNLKWRTRSTSTVYRTTRWAQPTNISTFLRELGSVHVMAAQPTLGSGTEETSSINITAPAKAGACDKLSRVTMSHSPQGIFLIPFLIRINLWHERYETTIRYFKNPCVLYREEINDDVR